MAETEPEPTRYASVADLRAATADAEIADDDPRALKLLEWASAKVDEYCGRSFPITPAETVPVVVVQIVATVAGRAWDNPKGAQTTSETAGPFGFATGFGSGQTSASVPMALRASEKDDLARYKVRRSGIGTIATERPVPIASTRYIGTADDGMPFPWPDVDYR